VAVGHPHAPAADLGVPIEGGGETGAGGALNLYCSLVACIFWPVSAVANLAIYALLDRPKR